MSDVVMLSGPREDTPAELGLEEVIVVGELPEEVIAELEEPVERGTAREFVDADGRTVYQDLSRAEQIEAALQELVAAGVIEIVRVTADGKSVYRQVGGGGPPA